MSASASFFTQWRVVTVRIRECDTELFLHVMDLEPGYLADSFRGASAKVSFMSSLRFQVSKLLHNRNKYQNEKDLQLINDVPD